MKCTIVQIATEMAVTGAPISTPRSIGEVDMPEPMTDAFLTATTVVGAVAMDGGPAGKATRARMSRGSTELRTSASESATASKQ